MAIGPVDNRLAILRQIYVRGPLSRSDLAASTGLTAAAVSRITRRLLDERVLDEGGKMEVSGKIGPRFMALNFSDSRFVVGVGVQAVAQWVEVADLRGHVIGRKDFALNKVSDPAVVLGRCALELEKILATLSIKKSQVCGVGLSVVGVVDINTGTVLRAQNLGWRQVPAARMLGEATGLPTYVESLLNSILLSANEFGLQNASRNTVLCAASLGIGAGIFVNGRVVSGSEFAAGQIGHVRVSGANGQCLCGRIGCLDTVASGRALLTRFELLDPKELIDSDGHDSAVALFRGLSERAASEPAVTEAFYAAGRTLGEVLGLATSLLDPDSIVLTGMVSEDDRFFAGVKESLAWYEGGTGKQQPRLSRMNTSSISAPTQLAFARHVLSNP